jgi:iron complex outermembrane receptor protein
VINNSGFEELDYSLALNYERDRFEHDFYYSHFGTELGIFSGAHIGNTSDLIRAIEQGRPSIDYTFSFDIDAPKQEISHDLISYKLGYKAPKAGEFELQYGYQQNNRQEFDVVGAASAGPREGPAFDLTLLTHSLNLKFDHNPVNGFYGTVGFTGMRQGNVRGSTGFLIPNFRSYNGGIFAIENWSNDNWTFETGVRYDYQWRRVFLVENNAVEEREFSYNNLTFVGGVIRKLGNNWSLAGNFGTAWRPPGVNEQFSDGVHHGTAQFELGDPTLTSERSYNADITLRRVSPKTYLQLSAYNNFIDDYIFLEPGADPILTIRGSFPFFSYRSADAILRGIDGTFEYQLFKRLRMGTSFSVIRASNLDDDTPLIFIPADRLSLSANYDIPDAGILRDNFFEVSGSLVAEQYRVPEGIDFAEPPSGYNLVNLQLGTSIGKSRDAVQLSVGINNLLNATYREYLSRFRYFIDEPGRNLVIRAKIPFSL